MISRLAVVPGDPDSPDSPESAWPYKLCVRNDKPRGCRHNTPRDGVCGWEVVDQDEDQD